LQVAVLLGWTVYGAVRERLAELEARLRGRPAAVVEPVAVAAPVRPPSAKAASTARRPDYSLN
jgi:hypothetical protein